MCDICLGRSFRLIVVCMCVCSDLCLQGQLVGYLDLSQLKSQVKLVFWVNRHSQSLLFEALDNTRKHTQKKLFYIYFCSVICFNVKHSGQQ